MSFPRFWIQLVAVAITGAILLLASRALAISTASPRATSQASSLEQGAGSPRRVSSIHAQRAPAAARASMNWEETAGAQATPSTCEWRQPYEVDTLGNVRHLHGSAQGSDARDLGGYSYTAFGKTIGLTDAGGIALPSVSNPLQWQGRRLIGPNLYDFRARVWSAELGAFLRPDEYGFLTPTGTLWSWPGQNLISGRRRCGRNRWLRGLRHLQPD